MTGILLLAVVGLWVALIWALTRWITRRITSKNLRWLTGTAFVLLVTPLPVADEIVGGFQFRALCRDGATLKIDPQKARGRTVRIVIAPSNELLPSTAIPIYHSHNSFQDVATGEEIAQYDDYFAKGGWFIHTLGISEGNAPLVIGNSGCIPHNAGTFPKQFGMILIN